ncbi:TPA: BREX-1 system adenine-specific DNA-methyltransferase PglX [Enterobacter hormaechei]|uniref:BREX-1 system adenine-specific DNA-methyltransferase PglX n=2 Tax=Enterobacter hormaechei TaxID=158836 RepID=UPI0007358E50|nr:BREX-1 system adenine-specific DNA-methyltransferase PglX [Enterobacter hormaechei]EKK5424588.1 BREX-1 system adenine-specific DNA-methyltransferase PglX [Enterobacter hormaechei]KTH19171.1 type II restriction endonuclease [Enterobacter hormaechei subsp. xiangfangensis]MDA4773549.1 BREX-1 system adenine-specific DNA-methyltransferase PglX [Enterobacter hormaechei]MEB6091538.1 BREX-1 system adenine-specific DNA-methyltransferase PglX [Enterobacter hormaechei]RAZ32361.1 BREX-1 system adenine-
MNTSNIKKYAPVARKQFRDAVMQKLTTLGIEADKKGNLQIAQATDLGDSVRYGQFSLDKSLASRRERLVKRAEKQGYEVLVEHIAYTWFNRFCAIRYMELHGYLEHGFRMLSHPTLEGGFEVLDHVPEVAEALDLDKARLVEMKLAGDRDEELYRELLLAQCHALHGAMPFLFEAVNDEIELVLPDNLTRTDSILRGLVDIIPEEDWEQVEVIGWLYQFYISEKKDDVIGKVVKSEDIPAATQLFTPNWIVQYLVQNSVGRQWLQTYPDSSLKGKMPYYIGPAEQTPEVQAQLAAITPSSIEPESIKVLDPACGSGHILTEAYNVLKAIYEERGYRTRDIPQLILENNIFGLDIDDRAAQLSGFAMMMLARQDDRRILGRGVRLNIISLQESKLDIAEVWTKLNFHQQAQRGSMGDMFTQGTSLANTDSAEYKLLMRTLALFTSAKTLGSLIQVPQEDEAALKAFLDGLYRLAVEGDIQQKEAAAELIPYIQQGWVLAQRYDAVVANPPYMGGKGMNGELKEFAKKLFPDSKSDLFAMFIERGFGWLKNSAFNSMVTMQSWMFLSSYENMRANILDKYTIENMVHMGNGVMKIAFGTNATIFRSSHIPSYQGTFSYAENNDINDEGYPIEFPVKNDRLKVAAAAGFKKIPGSPISYWLNENEINLFDNKKISQIAATRLGMATADNERFLRFWHEVDFSKIGFYYTDRTQAKESHLKWFPYQKGGEYRKWFGNLDYVVNWFNDGYEIQNFVDTDSGKVRSHNYNLDFIFKKGITWNALSSNKTSARVSEFSLFDNAGSSLFVNEEKHYLPILAFINSDIIISLIKAISPTMNYQPGDIGKLPASFDAELIAVLSSNTSELISLAKESWAQQETSYQYIFDHELFSYGSLKNKIDSLIDVCHKRVIKSYQLEKSNNVIFFEKYNIPHGGDVNIKEITLENNVFNSLEEVSKEEIYELRGIQIINLHSLVIGFMMGRYSLDRDGLVYAHGGNKGFAELVAEGAYKTFPADEDGILPLMDSDWFDDDVTARVKEFVRTVWGEEHLQENLDFIAESLCLYAIKPKKGESSLDTIRRYLSTQFWKDHMKMYKKRPIYWLFSSGKEKAFECLVYLHRYNEGTLSRMRTEYVVPLLARYQGNIDLLNDQLKNAESGAATTRLKKELDGLTKKFNELRSFDDRLRHYADRRITIDLDDGVKVNYGKFGDLLADVKAITGSAPEEI